MCRIKPDPGWEPKDAPRYGGYVPGLSVAVGRDHLRVQGEVMGGCLCTYQLVCVCTQCTRSPGTCVDKGGWGACVCLCVNRG